MDGESYLAHACGALAAIRRRADRAMAQVDDAGFFATLDGEANSIALIVKHVAGNQRSRWTDFLTTDGEKPDRRRDAEFVREPEDTRESLLRAWDAGWSTCLGAVGSLSAADLERRVEIRGEPHSVFDAIERQKEHYAYHVGQIVLLAKHAAGPAWKSLSVPRGQSKAFEADVRAGRVPGRG